MAITKSYTDLEQSRKLTKILPHESADMYYGYGKDKPEFLPVSDTEVKALCIPCWSLASLLEQLPYELCDDDGNSSYLQINKEDNVYQLVYEDPYWDFESIETDRYEHFVDACYEMIIKLSKIKLI